MTIYITGIRKAKTDRKVVVLTLIACSYYVVITTKVKHAFNSVGCINNHFPALKRTDFYINVWKRRVPLVEQELLTLPEHLSSPPVFSGVHVTRSLVLYVCFVDRCLSFCTFSFGHCVVCSSSIYGFWLPLWYLQTLLESKTRTEDNQSKQRTPDK